MEQSVPAQLLAGKVALVVGASSGIGRASALAFARAGARVVVSDVDADGGRETVHLIEGDGGEATFVRADVAQAADVAGLVEATVTAYGKLDCAHNNAGIEGPWGPVLDCAEEDWDRVIAVNLKGVWLCLKHEIGQMLRQGGGAIVNTSSIVGLVGSANLPAYSASKHGVVGLTRSAALGYAQVGIRVNAVCPGVIQTPMADRIFATRPELEERLRVAEPIGRFGRPEEVAAAAVWLCSDAASFVTGVALPVDGGWVAQ